MANTIEDPGGSIPPDTTDNGPAFNIEWLFTLQRVANGPVYRSGTIAPIDTINDVPYGDWVLTIEDEAKESPPMVSSVSLRPAPPAAPTLRTLQHPIVSPDGVTELHEVISFEPTLYRASVPVSGLSSVEFTIIPQMELNGVSLPVASYMRDYYPYTYRMRPGTKQAERSSIYAHVPTWEPIDYLLLPCPHDVYDFIEPNGTAHYGTVGKLSFNINWQGVYTYDSEGFPLDTEQPTQTGGTARASYNVAECKHIRIQPDTGFPEDDSFSDKCIRIPLYLFGLTKADYAGIPDGPPVLVVCPEDKKAYIDAPMSKPLLPGTPKKQRLSASWGGDNGFKVKYEIGPFSLDVSQLLKGNVKVRYMK